MDEEEDRDLVVCWMAAVVEAKLEWQVVSQEDEAEKRYGLKNGGRHRHGMDSEKGRKDRRGVDAGQSRNKRRTRRRTRRVVKRNE